MEGGLSFPDAGQGAEQGTESPVTTAAQTSAITSQTSLRWAPSSSPSSVQQTRGHWHSRTHSPSLHRLLPRSSQAPGSGIYIKCKAPAPLCLSIFHPDGVLCQGSHVTHLAATQSLSLRPLNDCIFKNQGGSCPLCALLRDALWNPVHLPDLQPLCFSLYLLTEGYFPDYISTYINLFLKHKTYFYTLYFILCYFLE